MTTLRQQRANEHNAQSSTGPKTEEGKDASRRNALTHGLTGNGVVLPELEAELLALRKDEWRRDFPVESSHKEFYLDQYVINSMRVARCQNHDIALREYDADRAKTCWDADRALDAARHGARLAKDPATVLRQLEISRHGCLWLIERWTELADVFERTGAWSDEQTAFALNLLGVSLHARDGLAIADPQALAFSNIQRLQDRISNALEDLDEHENLAATVGLAIEEGKPVKRVRRYEATCVNRMRQAFRHLTQPAADPLAELRTRPCAAPPEPEPEPEPPQDEAAIEAKFAAYLAGMEACATQFQVEEGQDDASAIDRDLLFAQAQERGRAELLRTTQAAAAAVPVPAVRLSDSLPTNPPPMNRKMRKAAKRQAAKSR